MLKKQSLNGPFLGSKNSNSIKNIIVMLHGYGSNGDDLIQIANQWSQKFEDFIFFAPNAPFINNNLRSGYMWFDVYPGGIALDEASDDMRKNAYDDYEKSCELIKECIYYLSKKYNVELNKIFLLGFSQGSMMSIEVGTQLKNNLAGIISLSGRVYTEIFSKENRIKSKLLIIHGDRDEIIKPFRFIETCEILEEIGFEVEKYLINNLGHSINEDVIDFCEKFILNNK
tara:strand:+ start:96 stop:779 length:684 start_codon:yes stop_codon:yes gene_type:complete